MKANALLANLGFVLQISGIFVLFPIVVSLVIEETQATVGLFIAASAFLAIGFLLNALCERKELSFKQSCTLFVLVFVVLSLIGSLPYMYINISPDTSPLQLFTDSFFESTSGFTTTGFSVIADVSALPQSIILYRALTQFIGGIGIVLILLAFFYPEAKLKELSRSIGFGTNYKIKKSFYLIITIYCTLTVALIVIGYFAGYSNPITLASFIFSAISTGGFAPVVDVAPAVTQSPLNFILIISMILGATNFVVLAGLFKKKFKEFFHSEFTVFIIIALISIIVAVFYFQFSPYDATFHIISAMSTTGFGYLPIANFPDAFKLLLMALMFIGGASLSTAGGIKIYRLLLLLKAVKKAIVDTITQKDSKLKLFGKEYDAPSIIQSGALVMLMFGIIFVASLIVTAYGFKPIDAAFEATAAIATTGLGIGIVGPTLALPLKWLFIFLMILGRVEIIPFLVIFSRTKERHSNSHNHKRNHNSASTHKPDEDSADSK